MELNKRARTWLVVAQRLLMLCMVSLTLPYVLGCERKTVNVPKANLAAFQLYVSAMIVAADKSEQLVPGRDCFADAGLKLTIIKRGKGPEIVDALVGGSADFGTLALTPVVLQILQDSNLVIFATIQTTNHDIKVVGHRSAGVDSGASLKGKRIGYVGGTFGEIFLDRYLKKHGLSRSAITLTSAGPAQLRDLFLAKSLDAIIIWEPIIQDILLDPAADKADLFLDVDTTIYTGRMNLVARPETLKQKRGEAERLVRAMICGEELIHKHPERVRQELEKWLDRPTGTLKNVFDKKTFTLELNVPALLADLKAEAEWAHRAVFNEKGHLPASFTPYVDSSIMEAVAPERVKR